MDVKGHLKYAVKKLCIGESDLSFVVEAKQQSADEAYKERLAGFGPGRPS